MKLHAGLVAFIFFSFSNGASMEKRNIFSPFDPNDTPDTFTKEDIEDAAFYTQMKTSAKSFSMPFIPFNYSSNPTFPKTKPNLKPSRTKVVRKPNSHSTSPSFDSFRKTKLPKPSAPKYSPKIPANFPRRQVQSGDLTQTSFISVASDIQPTVSKSNKIGVNPLSVEDTDEPNLYFYLYPDHHQDDRDYTPAASSYAHYDGYDGYGGYDTSSSHYGGGSGFFDMHAVHTRHLFKIALPLFLIGALLFCLSSLSTQAVSIGRSEDNTPSFISGLEEEVERWFKEYVSILESDNCTQRVLCEAGYATSDYTVTKILIRFMDLFLPTEMNRDLKVFKSTALNKKNVEKCNFFKCKIKKNQKENARYQKKQKENKASSKTRSTVVKKSTM